MTTAEQDARKFLRSFSTGKVLLPVIIGLGVTALLVWRSSGGQALQNVTWSWFSTWWMFLAFLSLVVRDWMYMVRIHHLTDKQLSWWRTFVVVMLWEFASAIAPGISGGGFFFAIVILSREGIDAGKCITVISFTSSLD